MHQNTFQFESITFQSTSDRDIPQIQEILNRAPYYHTTLLRQSSAGLADRCFHADPPTVEGSRVFRHLMLGSDSRLSISPSFVVDLFVGFPNYKTASIAMFVVREDCQRKGTGSAVLTAALPAFLREYHPAVRTLMVSLIENNVPALRCLIASKYERTNRWEKLDLQGNSVIALTYKLNF